MVFRVFLHIYLILHADKCCCLDIAEQGEADVPLDAGAGSVFGFHLAYPYDLQASRVGEAAKAIFAEGQGIDAGAGIAAIGRLYAARNGMCIPDEIVDGDGYAVIELDELAQCALADLEVIACCPGQSLYFPARPPAHHNQVGLAALDGIDKLVDHGKCERGARGARGDNLIAGSAGIDQLDQAVELVGIGRVISIDELIFQLVAYGLGGELDDGGLDILDIRPGLPDVVIHIGILAQDGERGRLLREGDAGTGGPVIVNRVPLRRGQGELAVIGEGVAIDLDPWQELQQGAILNDGLDNALVQDIIGESGCFG